MRRRAFAALLLAAVCGCAQVGDWAGDGGVEREPDVVYDPSPPEVVDAMLDLARVRAGDVVYDLGSGDGRIVIAAARRPGVRAVGIDIDRELVERAKDNARRAGVGARARFVHDDLFTADFREASVVTLFLFPEVNLKLRPILQRQLRPGARIVSHQYDMGTWKPDATLEVGHRTLYLWVVPNR